MINSTKSVETRVQEAIEFAANKVSSLIANGFSPSQTTRVMQGEVLKVDLTDGEITYRIVVLKRYEGFEEKVYCRVTKRKSGLYESGSGIFFEHRESFVLDEEF